MRISASRVAELTGRSLRTVQRRANEIPGAAFLLGRWTFDADAIQRWVADGAPLPEVPLSDAEIMARKLEPTSRAFWRRNCRVYFIQDGNLIKVGISLNPEARLAQLQKHTARPLTLLGHIAGDRDLEQAIHERFKRQRVKGEWFKATRPIRAFVAEAVAYAAFADAG